MPSASTTLFLPTLAIACLCAAPLTAQTTSRPDRYLDPSLPIAQRVDDLVGRMTLEEKIAQMQNDAPALPRLHIAAYDWWNEGLHGVARSGHATVFPQAIGLAATWDTDLMHRIADTIGTEARAKYNQAQREGNHAIFYGLTLWSPNINIFRDPRWGRGQETYGEDPFLTARMGTAFVRGLQGDDPKYLKTAATAKHYAVHSGPESERHTFDAVITPHDLADTYLPAFRALVTQGHVASVMCAYNSVDNAPACASNMLMQQTLRRDWGFHGYTVSDCAAITDVAIGHAYSPDMAHAAAAAVKAGTDISCGKEYAALTEAVAKGLLTESDIDHAVKHLLTTRFRLGMFDPSASVPYAAIPFSENDSVEHGQLSLEAARASMVLLKNDHDTLPLETKLGRLAVIGPNADSLAALEGNYNAVASHPVTPLTALQKELGNNVLYAQGSAYVDGLPVPVPQSLFASNSATNAPNGLNAEYFNGADFKGRPAVQRIDSTIDFDWNGASPASEISSTSFAVRWSGFLKPPASGTFNFAFALAHCSTCDDAETIHVWLDGKAVYEFNRAATRGRRAPTPPFTMKFSDTQLHAVKIEYTHSSPHFGAGITFNWKPPADILRAQAVEVAKHADTILAFVGLSPDLEGEEMPVHVDGFSGGDRTTIELPAAQQQLLNALAATGKPLVMVLMNGSAIALGTAANQASAIVEGWYPGQAGGTAIAETLFGENNPSGRLPITFYASTTQLPAFNDYSMAHRTYRYFDGEPSFPFGYGLSYTHFTYTHAKLTPVSLHAGDPLELTVEVKNTGSRDGDEVVEAYWLPGHKEGAPRLSLAAFTRVHLAKGASQQVQLTIDPRQISLVGTDGTRTIQPGDYELYVGGSQPGGDRKEGQALTFRIDGTQTLEP